MADYEKLLRENEPILRRRAGNGLDLDQHYAFEFVVRTKTEADAKVARKALRDQGYPALVTKWHAKPLFHAVFELRLIPDAAEITRIECMVQDICAAHGFQNDGWEFLEPPV
ncbi:MAG: ribonuclease E inhibitor RraB [Pseudomonadota bacterium]